MKICFLSYNLTDGGAQRVASVLCNDLVKRHEVLLIVKERCAKEYTISEGVKVITMDEDPGFKASRVKDFAAIGLLHRILKQERPDVVLGFLGFAEAAFLGTRGIRSLKYIATIQNSPWSKPEQKLRRWTRDMAAMLSPACMVQNHEQATYFPQWMQKKLFIMHNPVDPVYICADDHTYRPVRKLVTLGRLHDQKNQEMMIQAFAEIADAVDPAVCLEIYGDGAQKEKLQNLICELHMEERIHLLPFHKNPIEVYQKADAFILSSNFEGMPNALLEAMAVGLPCVSTDCRTGPKDIIRDGENGFLVPMNAPSQMAEKMKFLIDHPEDAERMGRAARKDVLASYTIDVVARDLEADLERICRG